MSAALALEAKDSTFRDAVLATAMPEEITSPPREGAASAISSSDSLVVSWARTVRRGRRRRGAERRGERIVGWDGGWGVVRGSDGTEMGKKRTSLLVRRGR